MSVHTEHLDDHDIYRGEPPSHDDVHGPGTAPSILSLSTVTSDSSSSSSSSSFLAGRRLGAIAAKLELAIARWGRNVRGASSVSSGSSSSSSSSSSSCSSIVTLTKSQIARRRRRTFRSVSSLRTNQSERDIAARITRMKALERSRQIPRKFALYLPPSIMPAVTQPSSGAVGELISRDEGTDRRITWTTSLPLVLNQLDLAMRRPGRNNHKNRPRAKRAQSAERPEPPSEFYFEAQTEDEGASSQLPELPFAAAASRGKKGKHRAVPGMRGVGRRPKATTILEEPQAKVEPKPKAWFLDVANPTWADLRAIGKVLHIHPLTLEDILQQDPREKLEVFSKLGYYFISFRAIESQVTREKVQREAGLKDTLGFLKSLPIDDSSIGEANVYLAVFKDGICCFHFTDVSEHTDRVRNRMVLLEQVINMSSDWIAHDILDSIVDSFFPFLQEIEKEVTTIDNMVYYLDDFESVSVVHPASTFGPNKPPARGSIVLPFETESKSDTLQTSVMRTPNQSPAEKEQQTDDKEAKEEAKGLQKYYTPAEKLRESYRPRFVSPRLSPRLLYRRLKRHVGSAWRALWWAKAESVPSARQTTLRRMARTRKLVTVLGRLLATKSDVVTQIRKRLAKAGAGVHGSEELEVAVYMGDVQDHILTLQNALVHYERMLIQSHPTYLAQLRSESEKAKGGMDTNLLLLSVVSIASLCVQPLIGLFSLNVTVPTNLPGKKYNLFGIVLALSAMIVFILLRFVRYWWRQTRRRMTGI